MTMRWHSTRNCLAGITVFGCVAGGLLAEPFLGRAPLAAPGPFQPTSFPASRPPSTMTVILTPNPRAALQAPLVVPPVRPVERTAVIEVRVPPDANLWFNGVRMSQEGTNRRFLSPPLDPGTSYVYEIDARWREGNRAVSLSQYVTIHAGDQVHLELPSQAVQPAMHISLIETPTPQPGNPLRTSHMSIREFAVPSAEPPPSVSTPFARSQEPAVTLGTVRPTSALDVPSTLRTNEDAVPERSITEFRKARRLSRSDADPR